MAFTSRKISWKFRLSGVLPGALHDPFTTVREDRNPSLQPSFCSKKEELKNVEPKNKKHKAHHEIDYRRFHYICWGATIYCGCVCASAAAATAARASAPSTSAATASTAVLSAAGVA
jgi:hypothetical protein